MMCHGPQSLRRFYFRCNRGRLQASAPTWNQSLGVARLERSQLASVREVIPMARAQCWIRSGKRPGYYVSAGETGQHRQVRLSCDVLECLGLCSRTPATHPRSSISCSRPTHLLRREPGPGLASSPPATQDPRRWSPSDRPQIRFHLRRRKGSSIKYGSCRQSDHRCCQ
jgi:hypothetical protein